MSALSPAGFYQKRRKTHNALEREAPSRNHSLNVTRAFPALSPKQLTDREGRGYIKAVCHLPSFLYNHSVAIRLFSKDGQDATMAASAGVSPKHDLKS